MKKLLMGSELFFLHAKDCSDGRGMPARNVFMGCVECSGAKGCPRNGRRGATCSAAKCKADYAAGRRPDAAVRERDQQAWTFIRNSLKAFFEKLRDD